MNTYNLLLSRNMTYAQANEFANNLIYKTVHITPQITPRGMNPLDVADDHLGVDPAMPVWEVSVNVQMETAEQSVYMSRSIDGPPTFNERVDELIKNFSLSYMQMKTTEQIRATIYRALPDLPPHYQSNINFILKEPRPGDRLLRDVKSVLLDAKIKELVD